MTTTPNPCTTTGSPSSIAEFDVLHKTPSDAFLRLGVLALAALWTTAYTALALLVLRMGLPLWAAPMWCLTMLVPMWMVMGSFSRIAHGEMDGQQLPDEELGRELRRRHGAAVGKSPEDDGTWLLLGAPLPVHVAVESHGWSKQTRSRMFTVTTTTRA